MNCNTIITKINKYLKIRKIKITILNPATIKSDYLSCEVIRCSDDGVSHICDLTGCGKASGRNFIGQLSAFCLIKAAVHIGIYDTAGYGIYRNMRWRKLLAECLVNAFIPPLQAEYATSQDAPTLPQTEEICSIRPHLSATM